MIRKKDKDLIASYFEDSSNLKGGFAEEIIIPESISEVPAILKECNEKKTPVTITGAGTGNTGARIPFGGVVISTEKLNKIVFVHDAPGGGYLKAESGVLIKDVKETAENAGLFYSYDPTEQTAFVGGTIGTNASGARSFKYGATRSSVHALKMVLADGSILDIKRGDVTAKARNISFDAGGKKYDIKLPSYRMPKTKNAAGYFVEDNMDLVDLFIGQEGTLGCVLEAVFKLAKKPDGILSVFAFFSSEHDALNFAIEARNISLINRRKYDEINAMAVEYFDTASLMLIHEKFGDVPRSAGACVFFEQETTAATEEKILDKWAGLVARHNGDADNAWVAANEVERKKLLDKRHWMGEAMGEIIKRNNMPKVTTDIAVPHKTFREMLAVYRKGFMDAEMEYCLFGHIGDSHMHMNLLPKTEDELKHARVIAMELIKKGVNLGGTVSAEHGIGKVRREYLKVMYGEKGVDEMIGVKKIIDPNLILGRGNIFELK